MTTCVSHKEIAAMITVFGEGRGFRVVWLLEEMGLQLPDISLKRSANGTPHHRVGAT